MYSRLAAITDESLDPTMQDAALPAGRTEWQPDPESDGMDPASPGGPSPYNGAEPFGEPVATDPEWLDPREKSGKETRMPYQPGPDVDVTTLHRARRDSYEKEGGTMTVDLLWSEASRDVEAEDARLRMARAKVATASLWPFLSLARSENEFEHRLALTADRITERVEPELIGQLVASLREDFRLTASSEEDEDDEEDDGEWQKPWEKKESSLAQPVQIFHVASQRWITVQGSQPITRDNPEANDAYFEDALEEGPNTGQTGQYPTFPAGPDPWNPVNSQFPMTPSPWTPANNWIERPMNFAPYRQAEASANPYYFAEGPEGVSGEPQQGFPADVSLPEPDERVDAYGTVPPVQSTGTTGDGHPYSASPAANRATGSRRPFVGSFYDPGDPSVRVLAVGGPYGSGNAYNPGGSEVGIGTVDSPTPPPTMMPGGPGSTAMPPMGGPMDQATPMTDMTGGETDKSVTAAQVRDRPDIFNPAGVADEYDDNTWDAAAKQRPMQSAEHRNVNTPQQPRDPIPQASSSGVYEEEQDPRRQASLVREMRQIIRASFKTVSAHEYAKVGSA